MFSDLIARARTVPIEREIDRRGIRLKRQGHEFVGPCPVCGGTDRFGVNTVKQVWNCRGCGKGGDVIALGCSFEEAIAVLVGGHDRQRDQEDHVLDGVDHDRGAAGRDLEHNRNLGARRLSHYFQMQDALRGWQ
jgi:DNA primase